MAPLETISHLYARDGSVYLVSGGAIIEHVSAADFAQLDWDADQAPVTITGDSVTIAAWVGTERRSFPALRWPTSLRSSGRTPTRNSQEQ